MAKEQDSKTASAAGGKSVGLLIAQLTVALVGLGISIFLTKDQYAYVMKMDEICTLEGCMAVKASAYSMVFDIPVALWACGFYLVAALVTLLGLFTKDEGRIRFTRAYLLLSGVAGVVVTLIMATVAFVILKVFCPYCFGLYLVSIAAIVLAYLYAGVSFGKLPSLVGGAVKPFFKDPLTLYLGGSIVIAIAAVIAVFGPAENVKPPVVKFLEDYDTITPIEVAVGLSPVKGKAEAKVTLIEFFDYKCPHCKEAHHLFENLTKAYPDELRFVPKNFPLDPKCNPKITPPGHEGSCRAAFLARCAADQGYYWEMHEWLFKEGAAKDGMEQRTFAEAMGLDLALLDECMNARGTKDAIQDDVRTAIKIGVQGTPTLIINGRKLGMPRDSRILELIIQHELERQ